MSYHEYMGSAYWKNVKTSYFGKHGKACAVCGKKAGTTLHHAKYDNKLYGKEPDEHLYPLAESITMNITKYTAHKQI